MAVRIHAQAFPRAAGGGGAVVAVILSTTGFGASSGGLAMGIVSHVPSDLKRYSTACPMKENVRLPLFTSSHQAQALAKFSSSMRMLSHVDPRLTSLKPIIRKLEQARRELPGDPDMYSPPEMYGGIKSRSSLR
jgi:hypothetical protein